MPDLSHLLPTFFGPGRRPAWLRRRARTVLSVLLLGLAAVLLLDSWRPPPPEPRATVVVAARDLPAGHVLAGDDLRTTDVPASLAASAGSAAADRSHLVGQVLAGAVEHGEPLRASRLLGRSSLATLGPGRLAIPVPVSSSLVARSARVGSRVDLVVDGRALATDVPVLATTAPAAPAGDAVGISTPIGGTGELLVAVRRVDALALAAAIGDPQSPRAPIVVLRS